MRIERAKKTRGTNGALPKGWLGLAGFEPTYGGIKTRDAHLHNQQLADLADPLGPSTPFASPSLPPELPLDSNAIDDEEP